MRLFLALLIACAGGAGMGYRHGYDSGVRSQLDHARRQMPASYFDDYYADPATRPVAATAPSRPAR